MVLYKDFPFVHQRLLNLINRRHGTQNIYMEVFAKVFEKCRLLTRLLGQNVENLDDYGCPKFKILSKRRVCGSAVVTLSDTKQSFTVARGKQRCTENGLFKICKFCTCLMYLCLLLI